MNDELHKAACIVNIMLFRRSLNLDERQTEKLRAVNEQMRDIFSISDEELNEALKR